MEEAGSKSIPERVHDMYYRMFPGAGCPVTGAGAKEKLMAASSSSSSGTSPSSNYKHPHIYDVYGRRIDQQAAEQPWRMPSFLYNTSFVVIDPANQMPLHPNQHPAAGQKSSLSTFRQQSTIPKAGTLDTWLYPSPQMFFNSLVRKNKADGVQEQDMDAVVAIHNSVNEATWSRLLQWEDMYAKLFSSSPVVAEGPRLLRFEGKPHQLSPKARMKKVFGYGEPFDRHDWVVDRGGREMRYVIDFYYDEKAAEENRWPFAVDVRPALDSTAAALLRARMLLHDMMTVTQKHGDGAVAANPSWQPQQSQTAAPQHFESKEGIH
nr:TPA_exp: holocytochrome c synthase [Ophioglossum vulgatum]